MANVFNFAKQEINNGDILLDADNIDCLLLETAPAAPLTDAYYDFTSVFAVLSDAAFAEADHASYATTTNGRRNVNVIAGTKNDTSNISEVKFTADASGGIATWLAVDVDVYKALLIYKRFGSLGSGGDTGAIPIAFCELTSDVTANGGDVTITFSGNIWMTFGN